MAKCIKLILFLLLTFLLCEIVSDSSTDKLEKTEIAIASNTTSQDKVGVPEFPYSPIAELASNLQSMMQQITINRLQRVILGGYYTSFLKNILLGCADRETSLLLHRGRIYTSTTSYFCQNASEYYVFALRRIII